MQNHLIFIVLLASVFFSASAGARQGDVVTVSDELEQLKTSVENHGNSLATLTNQVNEMVSKFQQMNGDIARNYKKNKDQDKILADAGSRLQVLEDKISMLTGQLSELKSEGLLPPKATTRFKEYQDLSRAVEYVNAQEYEKAIRELEGFLGEHPKSIYKSFAHYWIGESYYLQGDYPMAIKRYQELLKSNPRSAKAPTALYRQGLSFFHLNSFDDAKAFFAKVIRSYPQSIEAVQASSQIKRINRILRLKKQQELEMKMIQ